MRTAPESRKISAVLKALREGSLQPSPDFQRRAVWTNKDKIAFIETILLGYPFPEIYVASGDVDTQTGDATELLVDGQQRLRTIDEYFRGVKPFARTQSITRYRQLEDDQKRDFLNYDVSVRNLGIIGLDEVREVFQRMNATSYDLNDMERFNAAYIGEFKQFCERITLDDFLAEHKIFSAADIRRMKDVSFIASLATTMLSDYFHRDDEVEDYLERFDEEFAEAPALEARFSSAFSSIAQMGFDRDSRAWRKADFYTLFIEVDRIINREQQTLDEQAVGSRLAAFFQSVNALRGSEDAHTGAAGEYLNATLQSTNDRLVRATRGRILREIILTQN
ncbi:DUF262 domain-containing protein [uncultured Ruegeria sp.]|uniref:DUF262 domain-containing protein n=1 Tax=uncultured Ruegeria sp. TaxID=259304 RepID=UPI002639CC7E|nr:DUF262 domain-containing protein [uncultured Ruegeria sp.]